MKEKENQVSEHVKMKATCYGIKDLKTGILIGEFGKHYTVPTREDAERQLDLIKWCSVSSDVSSDDTKVLKVVKLAEVEE